MYEELVNLLRRCGKQKCKNCEYEHVLGCVTKMNEKAADAIEALSKMEKTTRWIPVTETPPLKVGDDGYNGYLVYSDGYCQVADYTVDKFDNVPYFHVNGEYEPGVTNWMLLPEPPKEE